MGRQNGGTRWYENASFCVVIIVRQNCTTLTLQSFAGTRWYENAFLCVVIIVRQDCTTLTLQLFGGTRWYENAFLYVVIIVRQNCTTLTLQSFSGRLRTHQLHFTHLLACKARLDPPEVLAVSWVQRSSGRWVAQVEACPGGCVGLGESSGVKLSGQDLETLRRLLSAPTFIATFVSQDRPLRKRLSGSVVNQFVD